MAEVKKVELRVKTAQGQDKTPDQLRAEMIQRMREQGTTAQHLCEVATPGITRNVDY